MNLLVTGASGFLGRNFLLASDKSWRIDAVYRSDGGFPGFLDRYGLSHVIPHRCDLSVGEQVRGMAARLPGQLDTILCLAAKADPAASQFDPAGDLRAGPLALATLLSAVRGERLVYLSSGAVYHGSHGSVGPHTPLAPCLPYAVGKLACERHVQWARQAGRIGRYVILRFFGAYGPFEAARKIHTRLARWAMAGAREPFVIRGDGRNLIDAMYSLDAVRGIKAVLDSAVADTVVDFATGVPLRINDLVERAVDIFELCDTRIEYAGDVVEYNEFVPSNQPMEQMFGFVPEVPLESGLLRLREHLAASGSGR